MTGSLLPLQLESVYNLLLCVCNCVHTCKCVRLCVSESMHVFIIPSAVLALLPLIGICCDDSLVQQSDWHIDRWKEQTSRENLVIGSVFLTKCPFFAVLQCFVFMGINNYTHGLYKKDTVYKRLDKKQINENSTVKGLLVG